MTDSFDPNLELFREASRENISLERVKNLLDRGAGPNFEVYDRVFTTTFYNFIMNKSLTYEILEALLEAGADVDENGGYCVYLFCATHSDADMLTLLLDYYGGDLNDKDPNGSKPFDYIEYYNEDKEAATINLLPVLIENGYVCTSY